MKSFFSRLQGHFKNQNSGRYLGIILSELISECPEMLIELFANGRSLAAEVKQGRLVPRSEWPFECAGEKVRKRQADLVLVDAADGRCRALLEIKMEDSELKGQFSDYRSFAEQGETPIPFTILCKYLKPQNVAVGAHQKIQKTISLSEYARGLSLGKYQSNYAVSLFLAYIKDMGIMFTDVPSDDLRMLLRKLFHERKGGQRIAAKHNIGAKIPDAFSSVLNNQFVISESFRSRLGAYRSTVDFGIELKTPPKESEGGYIKKQGGYLETYTGVPILTGNKVANDWLYLYYGLCYDLSDDNKPVIRAYASIRGKRLKGLLDDDDCLEELTQDRSFQANYKPEKLHTLIGSQIRGVLKQAALVKNMPSHYRAELAKVRKLMGT